MTHIFVMLLYFYWKVKPKWKVKMQKFDGKVIDINGFASALGDKCLKLLQFYALTGCDAVSLGD